MLRRVFIMFHSEAGNYVFTGFLPLNVRDMWWVMCLWLVQVLKDPAARAQYDQQLALHAAQQHIFVSETISIADMTVDLSSTAESTSSAQLYYLCRCGGSYWLDTCTIDSSRQEHFVLQCDTCSLYVEVHSNFQDISKPKCSSAHHDCA